MKNEEMRDSESGPGWVVWQTGDGHWRWATSGRGGIAGSGGAVILTRTQAVAAAKRVARGLRNNASQGVAR